MYPHDIYLTGYDTVAKSAGRFRYFILGLLVQQQMSGYDIKRFLESLGWLLGNPSFGSIYPALHALLDDDLVTVEVVARPDKPPRKIYAITEAGERALQDWVANPAEIGSNRKAFVMQLILLGDLSQAGVIAHLQQRRETVVANHLALEQTIQGMGDRASSGQRLALEYGLATADAELTWLDSTLAQMPADPSLDPS
jgi:PadR family transcriptional regulator AphA